MVGAGRAGDTDPHGRLGPLPEDRLVAPEGRLDSLVLGRLFDAMPMQVTAVDADLRFVYANREALALMGLAREEVVGRPVREFIDAATQARIQPMIARLRAGEPVLWTDWVVCGEGRRRYVEQVCSPCIDRDGRVIGFIAVSRDITGQKQREEELEARIRLAEQRERQHQADKFSAMGSLLAGVAHELNNPLAILVAQSTLLAETAADPDQKRRAERIHAAAERAGRIVKSFLSMARQRPETREPTRLNDLVAATADMLASGLRSHGVELALDLDPALPAVIADQDFLGQVIANLVINAQHGLVERPDPRRIKVSTRTADGRVVLEVADNGPGIPAALAERVFEPYFTTEPFGVGTGIGLSICKSVVESHGGTIGHAPAPGGGTVVTMALPAAAAPAAIHAGAEAGTGAGCLCVLVVDDDADMRESLAEMLELLGHQVLPAGTVRDALEGGVAEAADLVFVDLRMPGIDGLAFRDAVVARNPRLARRVVAMTGDAVEGPATVERHAGGAGVIPVMEKPFTLADVRQALAAFV